MSTRVPETRRLVIDKAKRIVDLFGELRANAGRPIERRGRNLRTPTKFPSPDELVCKHFGVRGELDHVNFPSLLETLRLLGGRPALIVETGSSAWGTDSSRLFDSYIASFGGNLWSVD